LSPPPPSSLAAIKPANPYSSGEMAVKMEREREILFLYVLLGGRRAFSL